jgi:hypothetical protein
MRQTYSHLITFLYKHRYFRDGLFKPIELSFAEGSPKLINDLGLIFKPFSGGFHLIASDPELLFNNTNDSIPIQLHLFCSDQQYINYTDLPAYKLTDKVLYFNNLIDTFNQNTNSFQLHHSEFAGSDELVPISSGKIIIPASVQNKVYRFTDVSVQEISPQCVIQSAQVSNEFMLANLPQGIIRVFEDSKEVYKVYFYPNAVWKKPMAIVEIFPGQLYKHFKEKGKVNYVLTFNNRQTIWKYFLVSPVYQKFNNLSIINKSKEQVFNAPQKQKVYKNPEALVFESKNKIPLSELTDETFQLVSNFDPEQRSGKVILKNLDKATPEQLYYDITNPEESAYSHIYL